MLKNTLRSKLLTWFLLIALIPLGFVSLLTYRSSVQALRKEVSSSLSALAKGKADHIGTYFRERKKDATILSHNPYVARALDEFVKAFEAGGLSSPQYAAALAEYKQFLTYYKDGYGYQDLLLISRAGDVVFSTVGRREIVGTNLRSNAFSNSELSKTFDAAHTLLTTEISDFRYYGPSQAPAAFVAAPILMGGRLSGVVALEFGTDQIYELARDYTGLGETGEIILAASADNTVMFVTPLRHDPDAAFRRKVLVGTSHSLPAQESAQGKKGAGAYVDYRGKRVLAAWRYLPHLRLGLVVKIDAEEAFAATRRLRHLSELIAIIAVIGVVLAGLRASRSIATPILALQEGTRIVGRGNLDHKVATDRSDEIGDLSRAFDAMTDHLKTTTASRDDLSREIEQRKEAERKVRDMVDELKRSNSELAQFAYVASHDLQEPLRKITAFGGLLEKACGEALTEEAKDSLDRMLNAAHRMHTLIHDLLAYSRVTTHAQPFMHVDLNKTLLEVLGDLEVRISETNGRVEPGPLPALDADPTQMRQLLQNLVGNALKYHRKDTPPIVRVYGRMPDQPDSAPAPSAAAQAGGPVPQGCCRILVEDNGIGFEPKYADRIFAVFQRLHRRSEYEGTGIGLAICRKIAERHGGSISVDSRPGEGSTFTVCLPLRHAKRKEEDHHA